MRLARFWKRWLKRLALQWLEDYLDDQVGQLLDYLDQRGWMSADGALHVPPDKLPQFARDLARGVVHVVEHG